jgi:hypothetical protein
MKTGVQVTQTVGHFMQDMVGQASNKQDAGLHYAIFHWIKFCFCGFIHLTKDSVGLNPGLMVLGSNRLNTTEPGAGCINAGVLSLRPTGAGCRVDLVCSFGGLGPCVVTKC